MSGKVSQRNEARAALAWNIATRKVEFTYKDISAETGIGIRSATALVRSWEARNAVSRIGKIGNRQGFRVNQDDRPAPARRDGSAIRHESVAGNMWRSMRGLRVFTPTDIAAHSNTPTCHVTLAAAQEYCQMLARAGYLKVERKAVPGRREAAYRLTRNTGPLPPRERRVRAVYDENLCEFTHMAGGI
ncbi:MAG: hypothetical protein IKG52_11275 [Rhodobacteraceae bacterium]|nr:hypothetical protein [Paracoccaceae bacterium]